MLIGIDASRANREHKTGVEWSSYYIIRWLAKLDGKNQYILYTDSPLRGGLLDLSTKQYNPEEAVEEKIEIDSRGWQNIKSPYNNFKARVLKWPFRYFWTQGRLSLEMLVHRPDLLFVPAHTLPIIHPGKSIVVIHDIGFKRDTRLYSREEIGSQSVNKKKLINFFVRLLTGGKYGANPADYLEWSTAYALKHAAKIITISNFSKQEIEDIYGDYEGKVEVVYNGYNKFLYRKTEDKELIKGSLRKYGIESPYILYVGRLERKKNTPALVEAFAIAKQRNKNFKHKLVLVGDAHYGFDEINYMIMQYALDDDVIMTGWADEADLPHIYSGADFFIFPSLYEGFGIPLLQAMACEVPIAASSSSCMPEIVGEAAVMFNPCDTESIAEAIEKLWRNHNDLKKDLVEKGKKQIKKFSWEKTAAGILKIITSLV